MFILPRMANWKTLRPPGLDFLQADTATRVKGSEISHA